MRAPGFWTKPGHALALALSPVAAIYGAVAARRLLRPGATAPVPVLCIGNFTAGGAGKTPVALAVADRLEALGRRPVFLTRGYGGDLREPTLVDLARHDAAATGDEPQLLARRAPTIVSPDRAAGALLAARHGDVIVMDDGLQNPSLRKTAALAVVDGATGLGNGLCIPAGPLRAPMAAQWPLVQAVAVMGEGAAGRALADEARRRGCAVFAARLQPAAGADALAGRRVFAFAGIGRPEKFFESLAQAGAEVAGTKSFADHQPYDARRLARLREEATRRNLTLVTTAKDMARLRAALPGDPLSDVGVLEVTACFEDPAALDAWLRDRLSGP
ncbi:MAG: tetraacyldisaccharide 4'-kinase [Alsobacter sp.]